MRRVSLVIALALVAGCSTVYRRSEFERVLAANAARAMDCPVAQLRITPVGDDMVDGTDLPVYQRVEGCRQSQVYRVKSYGYEAYATSSDSVEPIPQCGMAYEKNWPRRGRH